MVTVKTHHSKTPNSFSLDGLRILVIEDEEVLHVLLNDLLSELGCKVVGSAFRLTQASDLVHAIDFDIAILDIYLAGELSYPIAEELDLEGMPYFFLSGYPDFAIDPRFKDRICVHKPFNEGDLERAIYRVLANYTTCHQ